MAQPRTWMIMLGGLIMVLVSGGCGVRAPVSSLPGSSASSTRAGVPTSSSPTPAAFPDEANTGVPAGTPLTKYTGSCAFEKAGVVVQNKIIDCDRVAILAPDITIRSSQINGWIDVEPGNNAHLTLVESEVDAGKSQTPAVGFQNVKVRRSDIRGGQTSVQCASDCDIEDSLLHDQMKPVGPQHLGGYLSNGGSNVVLRHNTVECTPENNAEGGACTGSVQIFGDFGPLINFRFEDNLIKATPGGYCANFGYNPDTKKFGRNPTRIVVINNVFQRGPNGKCGVWGPMTGFNSGGKGNVFAGNTWDDGSPLHAT